MPRRSLPSPLTYVASADGRGPVLGGLNVIAGDGPATPPVPRASRRARSPMLSGRCWVQFKRRRCRR
eukprot:5912307-Pyramimonas_sp.AAC.1